MRKILIGSILALMLVLPIANAIDISIENSSEQESSIMQDFTHTVFVEYATKTTCPPCVTASAQLFSIYNSGDYDFHFATLVSDEGNLNVRLRLGELGVLYIPDVFFDGGFIRITGGQQNELPYRNAITQSGERDVPDIDVDLDATWLGGGKIKIEITVVNNEDDEFKGHIRTFIVEEESRWNDNGGNPYHFATLDIPIDKGLSIVKTESKPLGETYTFSKTWRGSLYGFDDIEQDNIMVMVAIYEKESGNIVESAAAEPTTKSGNRGHINFIFLRLLARFPVLERLLSLPMTN